MPKTKSTKPSPRRKKSVFRSDYRKLLQLLVAERVAAGLNQRQLAKLLSIHQPFVARYETGERRLDMIEFLDVASAIGFEPQSFMDKLIRAIGTAKTKKK